MALGEDVEVERGEPNKRRGEGGSGGRKKAEDEEEGGAFVNVQVARASLVTVAEWVAKVGAQAVFTLDGTRAMVGGAKGAGSGSGGRGGRGGGGGGRGGGGDGGGGDHGCYEESRTCPTCRMEDGTLTWTRCVGCEREVHTRCCLERRGGETVPRVRRRIR